MKARLTISLHDLSVRRGGKWVLKNVTWQLKPGERWALLGDNGAGKTQLLKVLHGDVWPTPKSSAHSGGRQYALAGEALQLLDVRPYLAYVGAEAQDKYARYDWNLKVHDLVGTGLHGTDILMRPLSRGETRRVAAQLRECRLQTLAGREFLSLSYGEKRLVLLARALVKQPHWLLLDEFYNGLDSTYRRRIDGLFARCKRRGQSWITTAHRAADVPTGTTHVLTLAQGEVRFSGPLKCMHLRGLSRRAEERPRPTAPRNAMARAQPVLIDLQRVNLYVEYREVLHDVNWQLRGGEHWAIFGANGAGKSSFLKLLYGDLSPALGGLLARRGFPQGTPIFAWKRNVALVSPELQTNYLINVSVLELVASGRFSSIGLADPLTKRVQTAAVAWLKFFELTRYANARPRELSYGQLRRALIARAMMSKPRILLLDEPLTGLDPTQRAIMKRLLFRLMKKNVSIIAAVHHREDLPDGITHALRLHKRRASAADFHSAT